MTPVRGGAAPGGALMLGLVLLPRAAFAHFTPGLDPLSYLGEGAMAVWAAPWLVLPVVALGLALGLCVPEGLWKALLALFVGLLVGLAVSAQVWVWAQVVPPLAVGLVVAVVAALVPPHRSGPALFGLAGFAGAVIGADVLDGYVFLDVPVTLLIGIAGAVIGTVGALAGAVLVTRLWIARPWVTILWRIAASWGAAIQVLYLAFILAG